MFGYWWIFIGVIIAGIVVVLICAASRADYNKYLLAGCIFWFCVGIALLGFLPLCILLPKRAHKEVAKYKYDYEMVQEVILNGTDLENIKITETVLDYNNWLSEAKADKETWGNWSVYYKEDLDSLNPIVIRRNDSKGGSNEND